MGESTLKIGVLGAGIVGLTAANCLQDEFRNANITLIADQFEDDTTSAVAAGMFRPGLSFRGPTKEITQQWIDDSWYYWQDILNTSIAPTAGVKSVSSYIFSKDNPHVTRNHLIEHLVPIYRAVSDDELKICGGDWRHGAFYSTVLTECTLHLPFLANKFTSKGGKIIKEKVESFQSLAGKYDLVFNCTGLGAKALCNDHDLVPLRGQIIKVKAPWLKMAYYGDFDTYIIPGFNDMVTLGGTRQYDSYRTEVCRHDAAGIWERCVDLVPGLRKEAVVMANKVGLRPHRGIVRVEPELLGGVKVVHCYGHGGYGVMCAPGTVQHALRIGKDFIKSNVKNRL